MFTGLIEELGRVKEIKKTPQSAVITLLAQEILQDVKLGDSIAVNGVCLTVVSFTTNRFTVEVMAETLGKTNLRNLTAGSLVNLERAMRLGDRLGGHLVSGHVDGVGRIVRKERVEIAEVVTVSAPDEVLRYTVRKGSIAIDGISLTVVDLGDDWLTVSLIPHTAKMTTLGYKQIGEEVNLEADLIGKYVARLLAGRTEGPKRQPLTREFLAEHGF